MRQLDFRNQVLSRILARQVGGPNVPWGDDLKAVRKKAIMEALQVRPVVSFASAFLPAAQPVGPFTTFYTPDYGFPFILTNLSCDARTGSSSVWDVSVRNLGVRDEINTPTGINRFNIECLAANQATVQITQGQAFQKKLEMPILFMPHDRWAFDVKVLTSPLLNGILTLGFQGLQILAPGDPDAELLGETKRNVESFLVDSEPRTKILRSQFAYGTASGGETAQSQTRRIGEPMLLLAIASDLQNSYVQIFDDADNMGSRFSFSTLGASPAASGGGAPLGAVNPGQVPSWLFAPSNPIPFGGASFGGIPTYYWLSKPYFLRRGTYLRNVCVNGNPTLNILTAINPVTTPQNFDGPGPNNIYYLCRTI